MVSTHQQIVEIEYLHVCREKLVNDLIKLEKFLKTLPKPENIIERIHLEKLGKICNFICNENELRYENRASLIKHVKDLINS